MASQWKEIVPVMRAENGEQNAAARLGTAAGWLIAPLFFVTSFARHARTFHPRGPTFHATVRPSDDAPAELRTLAERVAGRALVRFSGALWKRQRRAPDVLGCAVRLRRDAGDTEEAGPDDQDLLFATIRRPWTMGLAPFTTDTTDYLGNDYFAVSPFDAPERPRLFLRLHPSHSPAGTPSSDTGRESTREERLRDEVRKGGVALTLEVSDRPFGAWSPIARLTLEREAQVDGEALRFLPFRHGRGLRPRGFVHALRAGVYAVSQKGRPQHGGA